MKFPWRLLRQRESERDLDEEIRGFFESHVERAMSRGMTRAEAERAVRIQFGGAEQTKEQVREVRVGTLIETTIRDIRIAARVLMRDRGFAFFAVVTIALALGANVAIFTLVDGVLLKSIGYPEPERIVQLWERHPTGSRNVISPANYLDWAAQSRSFESMAAISGAGMSYSSGGEPRPLRAGVVSAGYFDAMGTRAALGRTFAKGEDQPGYGKVVVLSHRVWTALLAADRAAVGRSMQLDGEPYTIIGVLPAASPFDRHPNDIWVPLVFPPNPARDYHSFSAVARLKRGVSVEQAQSEMSAIAAGIAQRFPAIKKDWGATVDRYADRMVSNQLQTSLKMLMGAVAAILLIGCANLANLLMARSTLRSREMSLRLALGAGRNRIVRMLLTESLLLTIGGAAAGIAVGYALWRWIESMLPPFALPAEASVALDGRVALFLGAIAMLTTVAFGLAPAIQAARGQAADALREGGRAQTLGRGQAYARHAFVSLQVAAALILLSGAGLLIRSFDKLMGVELGFETEGLIAAYLPMPDENNPDPAKLTQYIDRIVEEVRHAPGVTETGVATAIPLRGWGDSMPMRMPDRPGETMFTGFKVVTPGYLRALGPRLREGRLLDERDTAGSPPVVVVNESFVNRYWPNQKAAGKRILVDRLLPGRNGVGPTVSWEVVGVVADEKGRGVDSPVDIGAYAAFAQSPVVGLGLVARGRGEGGALIRTVQQAVWRVNKNQVLDRPSTVEELRSRALSGRRTLTLLLSAFALLAVLLACAGVYGVLSLVTARRTREIGIRAAMGASRGDLIRMVLANGATPVGLGIAVGLAGAIALARLIRAILFAVEPADPATLIGAILLFSAVALLACFVPAWRAARIDPMSALRQD